MVEVVTDKQEWGKCIAIGSTSLIVSALLKMISIGQVEKYAGPLDFVDEDKEVKSKVLESYAAANQMKIQMPGEEKEKYDDNQDEDQKPEGAGDEEFTTLN